MSNIKQTVFPSFLPFLGHTKKSDGFLSNSYFHELLQDSFFFLFPLVIEVLLLLFDDQFTCQTTCPCHPSHQGNFSPRISPRICLHRILHPRILHPRICLHDILHLSVFLCSTSQEVFCLDPGPGPLTLTASAWMTQTDGWNPQTGSCLTLDPLNWASCNKYSD